MTVSVTTVRQVIVHATRAVELQPRFVPGHFFLAQIYDSMGEHSDAQEHIATVRNANHGINTHWKGMKGCRGGEKSVTEYHGVRRNVLCAYCSVCGSREWEISLPFYYLTDRMRLLFSLFLPLPRSPGAGIVARERPRNHHRELHTTVLLRRCYAR